MLELAADDPRFTEKWQNYLRPRRTKHCGEVVAAIIRDVKKNGDAALRRYNRKFDGCRTLKAPTKAIREAAKYCDKEYLWALKFAARRISDFHKKTLPKGFEYTDALGLRLGQRWRPIASAGLYVPGGTAAYPSSVLMNALPAKIAGVKNIVATAPCPGGELNMQVLAACHLMDISEVYTIGGAQAVAALAYGTESVRRVDKIVGPGNQWVNEAKRQVFGDVGIDTLAGPSEVLIIADKNNRPDLIAADLLAQAEHDPLARSILITDCPKLAAAVKSEVAAGLQTLPRRKVAAESWRRHGAIILVADILRHAPSLADEVAAEHVQICSKDPDKLLDKLNYGGSIFLGESSPEALGDYVAGPNHVLPTGRAAKFASGLSVSDFMVRNTTICAGPEGFKATAAAAVTFAEAEKLEAHARSIRLRMEKNA